MREIYACGLRNPAIFFAKPVPWALESWIQLKEAGIHSPLESGIQIPLTKNSESIILNPESMAWNPESQTVLDSLGEL